MSHLVDSFTRAWRTEAATRGAELLPSALARACAHALRYDGAGLCLMSGPEARVPLGASDEVAAVAERLQYTVGEGPCFSAVRTGRAVLVTEEEWVRQWPVLAELHFARTPFRGGLSLPLRVGSARIGVLDLYLQRSRPLRGGDVMDAQRIAAAVTTVLLGTLQEHRERPGHSEADHRAPWRGGLGHPRGREGSTVHDGAFDDVLGDDVGDDDRTDGADLVGSATSAAWLDSAAARRRRQVWIATGRAGLVLDLPSEHALALLRAHAYATGQSLDVLAEGVVTGRFDVGALSLDQPR